MAQDHPEGKPQGLILVVKGIWVISSWDNWKNTSCFSGT